MKDILKIVFVIIGTFIGAGFASGQEINSFFFSYGLKGFFGLILSIIVIGIIIYKTLFIMLKYDIDNYKEFLVSIFRIKNRNSFIIDVINMIINLFVLSIFFIMVAGFGTYFNQEYGINKLIGSSTLSISCFLILSKDVKGVIRVSEIIVPILILLLVIIGILFSSKISLNEIQKNLVENNTGNFIISAISYSGYNSILLIPLLFSFKKYISNINQIKSVSTISVVILLVLSSIIFFGLTKVDVNISLLEMPTVYVISTFFRELKYMYSFIILRINFYYCDIIRDELSKKQL